MAPDLIQPPHDHDYDRDVENVDDLEPDYDAEEVDEVDEEVEPVPFDELVDAATEEDQA